MQPKNLLPVIILLLSPTLFFAQSKKNSNPISIGLQSGVHLSFSSIEESPVDKEAFLGLSFGIVAQKKLLSTKFRWAGFTRKVGVHLETGLMGIRDGYQYQFGEQGFSQEEFSLKIPLVFLLKADDKKFHKGLQKHHLQWIVRYGASISWRQRKNINKTYTDSDGNTLQEISTQTTRIRIPFYGSIGVEKQHADGGRSFSGLSVHMSGKPTVEGEIEVIRNGQQAIGVLQKNVFYYSIV